MVSVKDILVALFAMVLFLAVGIVISVMLSYIGIFIFGILFAVLVILAAIKVKTLWS